MIERTAATSGPRPLRECARPRCRRATGVDTPLAGAYDATMKRSACVACFILATLASIAHAQQPAAVAPQRPAQPPPPAAKTGNPTPGTPQPEPPNIADRITVSGCLQLAPGAGAAPSSALTTPANNRFVVSEAKKDGRVPPDTGTSSAAAASSATTYRLEALESQLSAFLDTRVEVSGEVKATSETPPVLLVEFVRKLAPRCS
jgi:hypothetical protein